LVLGCPVRCGLSSVYGFRGGLELDVLGDGGGGWLKSVSLAQKLIIIESACARCAPRDGQDRPIQHAGQHLRKSGENK